MKKLKKGDKILIANDSLGITGVQTYITQTEKVLRKMGFEVVRIEPSDPEFFTLPVYKDFNWALFATPIVTQKILKERPDAIFITTVEGPVGNATKNVCKFFEQSKYCKNCPYTASYTTNHGKYIKKLLEHSLLGEMSDGIDIAKNIENGIIDFSETQFLKNKFSGAKKIMVNSKDSKKKLAKIGFKNVSISKRGIDPKQSRLPQKGDINPFEQYDWYRENPLPILITLGRVAYEKDLQLFLTGDHPEYHRVIVGDGPAMEYLKNIAKDKENIHFVGKVPNDQVSSYFQFARVMFFPSSFDTFGQTMIESSACGTPVIGYNVQGPKDVIKKGVTGIILAPGKDMFEGLSKALEIDRVKCSQYTQENFSWQKATEELVDNLYRIKWRKPLAY